MRKVAAPDGPVLPAADICPDVVQAWRRERLAHCIATLLRDPGVARSVATGMRARCDDAPARMVLVAVSVDALARECDRLSARLSRS